ncbi:helix-turn-helix transcriptional regulator [Streptomyces sp. NPDC002132]|uniref:helix-turn-helix domain-containing protein n=1 Tax=Streptomyces TaxID=1883 RepID=UPI00099E21A0|nr:hypothetical protein GCM10010279_03220 [Streptomyces mutabilis]
MEPGVRALPEDGYEERLTAELARLPRDVTVEISRLQRASGLTQSALAARMGVTQGRVSQVLSGDANATLRTLASAAAALDAHFVIRLEPNPPKADE